MRTKFTDTFIRSLKATGKPYAVSDTSCKGLLVRVSAQGSKAFALAFHSPVRGKTAYLTFGRYPDVSLKAAHERAAAARVDIAAGRDPQGDKIEARATQKKRVNYGELVDIYATEVLFHQRTAHDRELILRRMGVRYGWTDRAANDITPVAAWDALAHLAAVGGRGGRPAPVAALAAKSILRTMFKWARQPHRGHVDHNPFGDLEAPARKPKPRERTLSLHELAQVWRAMDEPGALGIGPAGTLTLRLIFVTAARPGMVVGMARSELIALDAAQPSRALRLVGSKIETGPIWDLPPARMKKNRRFICPLGPLAVDLIRSSVTAGDRVIGAPYLSRPNTVMTVPALGKICRKLCKALGLARFTPHDLRRTASSLLGQHGWPDDMIGKLLAHDSDSVTAKHYNNNALAYLSEKREMVLLLEKLLEEALRDFDGQAAHDITQQQLRA